MKKPLVAIFVLTCFMVVSCKKSRECECKNANGVYFAGEIDATKSKAKKHCKSLSTGATECYLK